MREREDAIQLFALHPIRELARLVACVGSALEHGDDDYFHWNRMRGLERPLPLPPAWYDYWVARAFLLLAALLSGPCLRAQGSGISAPSLSATSIVNSASGNPTYLTPDGLATIYGSNLAFVKAEAPVGASGKGTLPTSLGGVQVVVGGILASLLYVSPTQVNFLMPVNLLPGQTTLTLVRDSAATTPTPITLLEVAPAIFVVDTGIAAEHADGGLISADSPAEPGEVIVVYGTGLGKTNPLQVNGVAPASAAPILMMSQLQVLLDGQALPQENIQYAGITPGYPGLYQVNVQLPDDLSGSPALQLSLGNLTSQDSVQLPVARP